MQFGYLTNQNISLGSVWDWAKRLVTDLNRMSMDAPPSGMIAAWAGQNVPDGWLLANGASVLKANYPTLYNALGYAYGGSGDNFNLPNQSFGSLPGIVKV